MTNWLFSKEELERKSPSLQDGIDGRAEEIYRGYYCSFIRELGIKLQVSQVTITTAITFCHRFYTRQSLAKNDCLIVGTACMFLASKVEETHRYLKEVVVTSFVLRHQDNSNATQLINENRALYVAEKELLLDGERLVLSVLEFDLQVENPHKSLVKALKKFRLTRPDMVQNSWNFVNDGLRTSLVLQFKPSQIAAGAIYLAARMLKINLPEENGEGRFWWQELDVTPAQLEDISKQLLRVYDVEQRVPPKRIVK